MDISASDLHRKSGIGQINSEIIDILKAIKYKIIDAHTNGFCEIDFELPDIFSVNSMDLGDLQTIIYSRVIEKLEEKDFNVKLRVKGSSSYTLNIRWRSLLDPAEKEHMKAVIISHLTKN